MKRFLIFAMLIMAIGLSAQKLTTQVWNYSYAGVATDTIGAGNTTWSKVITVVVPYPVAYVFQVKVSDRAAGAAATVALQAKNFATDAYSTLSTVTWTGVGSTDSVITFDSGTNKLKYNYYKLLVTRTASSCNVNWVKGFIRQ